MCLAYGDINKIISKIYNQIAKNLVWKKKLKKCDALLLKETSVDKEKHAMYFRYVPLTSVEVERNFSKLKMILSDQRISLKTENVKNAINYIL